MLHAPQLDWGPLTITAGSAISVSLLRSVERAEGGVAFSPAPLLALVDGEGNVVDHGDDQGEAQVYLELAPEGEELLLLDGAENFSGTGCSCGKFSHLISLTKLSKCSPWERHQSSRILDCTPLLGSPGKVSHLILLTKLSKCSPQGGHHYTRLYSFSARRHHVMTYISIHDERVFLLIMSSICISLAMCP